GADALEAHVLLLHHAYLFWASAQHVYQISEPTLHRAVAEQRFTTRLPHPAQYLQLPELRVWGAPNEASTPEPLDGMFVSAAGWAAGGAGWAGGDGGALEVRAIYEMDPDRPGLSAVGLEGRAAPNDPPAGEIEIAAARDDGSAPFAPKLAGGT